ncbi:inositol phosphorylceramide synthase [Candidatus Woesearchaeota archaeon]|nr:inositol phosphorylceramide synthase [Candidatus Woesearchaeota archaeon]
MTPKEFYSKYTREIWLGITISIWIAPYFLINTFSQGRVELTLNTFLDQVFPVLPIMVLFYLSSFALVLAPYFAVENRERFKAAAKSYLLAMTVSYLTFLLFPVKAIRPAILSTDIFSRLLQWVYSADLPYNNFPSLHITLSLLSAWIINHENKKVGKWMILWAVMVLWSTLFTKQHTIIDVVGGLALSSIGYLAYKRLIRTLHESTKTSHE